MTSCFEYMSTDHLSIVGPRESERSSAVQKASDFCRESGSGSRTVTTKRLNHRRLLRVREAAGTEPKPVCTGGAFNHLFSAFTLFLLPSPCARGSRNLSEARLQGGARNRHFPGPLCPRCAHPSAFAAVQAHAAVGTVRARRVRRR